MFHTFNLRRNRFVVLLALGMLFALALPVSADQADPNSATPPLQTAPAASNTGSAAAPSAVTERAAIAGILAPTAFTGITDPALITPSTVYDFSGDAEFSTPTAFPDGTFSGTGEVRVTGSSWGTWNPNVAGIHVLFASAGSYEIIFNELQTGVGAVAEPNNFNIYDITIEAFDAGGASLGSFTRAIDGDAGAAFLGVLSDAANIKRVVLSSAAEAGGFAFTDLTYGGTPAVPATVLLLKDVNPWSSTANEQILTANGISYIVIGSAGIPAVDLNQYPVVIVAGDQPTSFYAVLDANEAKFSAYVMAGGMLQFSIAGWGWNSGDPSSIMLPGGASIHPQYDSYNYLTMPGHPVVAGVSNPFYGSSASHAYLAGFPGGASVIATAGAEPGGVPTLVEYPYGNGCVLALGQPLEYGYEYGQASGTILKNAILHSVYSPCSGGPGPVGGRLFGWLFIDADEDGWRDVGENEGLPLVLVQLRTGEGTLIQETYSTLPRGWYEFNGIGAADYCLRIAVPGDYVTTTPSEACFTFDGTNLNVNFGLIKAQAGIGDTVFADANANGVQDAGEMGYAGVTLALWSEAAGAPGAVIATTTTDADGTYHFTVTPGTHFVQVTDTANVLAGLSLTAGTNPAGPITVGLNEQNLDIDFGYGFACPANRSVLSGRVWEDLNGDSLLDAGDAGIAGVQVCAQPLSQAYAARCTTTGADGMYRMCVRPMSYLVAPVVDATSPVHGLMPINKAFRLPVGVKPGMQVTDINFGFTRFTPVQ